MTLVVIIIIIIIIIKLNPLLKCDNDLLINRWSCLARDRRRTIFASLLLRMMCEVMWMCTGIEKGCSCHFLTFKATNPWDRPRLRRTNEREWRDVYRRADPLRLVGDGQTSLLWVLRGRYVTFSYRALNSSVFEYFVFENEVDFDRHIAKPRARRVRVFAFLGQISMQGVWFLERSRWDMLVWTRRSVRTC